jgi:hypothetical protein
MTNLYPEQYDSVPSTSLYIKPGSHVEFVGHSEVIKVMNSHETDAYRYLDSNRALLVSNDLNILVPDLLSYDETNSSARLTNIGIFPNLSPEKYFGRWEGYDGVYFTRMNAVFQKLRDLLPVDSIPNSTDYEADENGVPSSIRYLASGVSSDMPEIYHERFAEIRQLISASQNAILNLPQYAAHRDPNPNNYCIVDNKTVGIVDWETFGLARKGYDEARLLTYLALNKQAQDQYLEICGEKITDGPTGLYFWRVACMRAFREATSFHSGHYDSRLAGSDDDTKQVIIDALFGIVDRATQEIRSRM